MCRSRGMRTLLILTFAVCACTKGTPSTMPQPLDTDGPVNCQHDQFKAKERCFDHAADACASLGCGTDCDIHQARSSEWVTCDPAHRGSSSHLTRCGGYSGWLCPEDTVCRDDPTPGACRAIAADDCIGVCVPADAGPPSPGR